MCKMQKPNEVDRFLVQFRTVGADDFKTDCAFRDGQLDQAKRYIDAVLDCDAARIEDGRALPIVAGRVLDCWRPDGDEVVYEVGE
jgi:hypothetical protein